ncbi:hypothetical protein EYZ11_012059 [Aspergillus tanneri]|uniref:CCHC-type domain-containing protein n=1 Tax=Aspergillus tanneri TaxID=1220188 RepID=A0A4S3J174_9EURO|nr:hypothetical protein EYZ11_012059 [Aspergillus tanneri]
MVLSSQAINPRKNDCVRIITQRSFVDPRDNDNSDGNTFGRYLPTDTANTYIRTALLNTSATQDAEVAGIGTTKTGYVTRFKDPESTEAARNNTGWLNELGNSTKIVKPRFGVVVHRTPTEDFDLENVSALAIEKIIEENNLVEHGFRIEEVAWLKRKDKALGKFASLAIWFDSAEGAEYILNNGLLVGQRYIGSVSSVDRREIKKKRCFRCQRFGHLAWSCKETPSVDTVPANTSGNDAPGVSYPGLINDHHSQNLDVQPSITTYQTHVNHSAWRLYRPTIETDAVRFRSLVYVNRRISTSSYWQIPFYLPPVPLYTSNEESVESALTAIQNTITTALRDEYRSTSVVLAGDFNRHHPIWGGGHIQPQFIEDGSELINFFQANGLHSCLPRGTATFWSLSNPGRNSTIDQTVTNRPDPLIKCHLYHDNYGSDQRATYSEWNLRVQRKPTAKAKKAFDRADWDSIASEVLQQMGPWKEVKIRPALDEVVERSTEATASTVDRHTPNLLPIPYSKRWFMPNLKIQQTQVNQLRRKWQENCAELGREHARSATLFQEMQQKRRAWTGTIEKAKASHWNQFLDKAGEGKLWEAAHT